MSLDDDPPQLYNRALRRRNRRRRIAALARAGLCFILIAVSIFLYSDRRAQHQVELAEAARQGDYAAVKNLLSRGVDPDSRLEGQDAIQKFLLRLDDAPPGDGTPLEDTTALVAAAANGHCDIVELLLAKGADVNAHCWYREYKNTEGSCVVDATALREALEYGYIEVVRTLIRHGANVNDPRFSKPDTAMQLAESQHHSDIVQLLQQAGAKE